MLEMIWRDIESKRDLSPFLSYDFFVYHLSVVNRLISSLKHERLCFYTILKNDEIICIAPIKISRGNVSTSDIAAVCDFIYYESMSYDSLERCVSILEENLGHIVFNNVLESSMLYAVLQKRKRCKQTPNVRIGTTYRYEEYYSSLSKNCRQNIRTAYNRINKDKATLRFEITEGGCGISLLEKEMEVYIKRRRQKYSKLTVFHDLYFRFFHPTTNILRNWKRSEHFCLYINKKLAAFGGGYLSSDKKTLVIPRLAINNQFSKYSPGVLLINEYYRNIKGNEHINWFDLSKGDEKYKLEMGGEIYYTHSFE